MICEYEHCLTIVDVKTSAILNVHIGKFNLHSKSNWKRVLIASFSLNLEIRFLHYLYALLCF